MITDYIRQPKYRQACKVAPKIKPRTARFKRTAIASGIHQYNKLHTNTASLNPKKCKKLIYEMEKYDKEPKISQLNKVNKPSEPKLNKVTRPSTQKFPGAQSNYAKTPEDNSIYYKYITTLFEQPKMDDIDIRIIEMEESLGAMIDDDYDELYHPSSQ